MLKKGIDGVDSTHILAEFARAIFFKKFKTSGDVVPSPAVPLLCHSKDLLPHHIPAKLDIGFRSDCPSQFYPWVYKWFTVHYCDRGGKYYLIHV